MGSKTGKIGDSKAVKVARKISKQLDKLNKVMSGGGTSPTTTTTTTI